MNYIDTRASGLINYKGAKVLMSNYFIFYLMWEKFGVGRNLANGAQFAKFLQLN